MSEVTRNKRRQSSNTTWRKAWILLGIVFVVIAGQQLYTIHTLNQEKEQLQQQLQELKQENENLSEQKKLLEDDKHIESVAREELGLVKPGEVPYVR